MYYKTVKCNINVRNGNKKLNEQDWKCRLTKFYEIFKDLADVKASYSFHKETMIFILSAKMHFSSRNKKEEVQCKWKKGSVKTLKFLYLEDHNKHCYILNI
jgi:hypothetical protein